MEKPSEPIRAHRDWDYELDAHVTRALQHSALHVFVALIEVSTPLDLGGDPDDILTSMGLSVVLVTDGVRGWLGLVQASDELDWGPETREALDDLVCEYPNAAPHACLAVSSWPSQPLAPSAFDLRDERTTRLEELFEEKFGESPSLAPEAFEPLIESMHVHNFGWLDELELRMNMDEGPVESLETTSGTPNRHERRRQKALKRKKRGAKRR